MTKEKAQLLQAHTGVMQKMVQGRKENTKKTAESYEGCGTETREAGGERRKSTGYEQNAPKAKSR